MTTAYVHGYSETETCRLRDQAGTLTDLLHAGTVYPPGSTVLEAGCGVGAQTVILCRNSPEARFTALDISQQSLEKAALAVREAGCGHVSFQQGDIYAPPFPAEFFDHVFLCFVLEHLPEPASALSALRRVLKPGGSITVIEGDHGSFYCHPETPAARHAVRCLIDVQALSGGDALIGRRVYPLMTRAGFRRVRVTPRMVYVDDSRPDLVDGFTRKTFTAMVAGVRDQALALCMSDPDRFDQGVRDLYRTAEGGGTFCYTFFKGVGSR